MSARSSTGLQVPLSERLDWRRWVTPKPLQNKPIHRWFTFPHSYTDDLVDALIDAWRLTPADHILDPFTGSGTTLLAAKQKGIPATGCDLSPLAVLASRVKVAELDAHRLAELKARLDAELDQGPERALARDYPDLVRKALPGPLLRALDSAAGSIARLECTEIERDFFRLALLWILPTFSHAVAAGGWLKWVDKDIDPERVPKVFSDRTALMLLDVQQSAYRRSGHWNAQLADARCLPFEDARYSAVITSPPYPNRHDYTRVFGVELMFTFLNWQELRELRYQSFHSHPEARPNRPPADGYVEPSVVAEAIADLQRLGADGRVIRMLRGYFVDTYLCLQEMRRIVRKGGRIALVVGNAQYHGIAVPVDKATADIGRQAGLCCAEIVTVRYRGNSAQQMGRFGRQPSRECIVAFSNGPVRRASDQT